MENSKRVNYGIRTDLALEEKERYEQDNVEISGVILEEKTLEKQDVKISKVIIETEKGARAMGKPKGTYITLEAAAMSEPDEDYHREISEILGSYILELLPEKEELSVLAVGLGNNQITADSLGPYVVDNLQINRHLVMEYGRRILNKEKAILLSGLIPGVMGKTGMETVEIIQGVVKEAKVDVVIAIDALAARNTKRLNRTIQIANTGIHPGSGVGNNRHAINEETLGIPVIAIGVPTVVDAATIVGDSMENLLKAIEETGVVEGLSKSYENFAQAERHSLVKEVLSPNLNGMYVTPKDIDETVKRISYTISEALNAVLIG